MDELIKKLIRSQCDISLVLDDAPDVFICPAILDSGQLEYQVSDGLPSRRGISVDVYTWEEAVKTAKTMQTAVPDTVMS